MSKSEFEAEKNAEPEGVTPLPKAPVDRWVKPFAKFLQLESASGAVLLVCTAVALIVANSTWSVPFKEFWKTPIFIGIGQFGLNKPIDWWVNDALMAIFFFVVGLEIKRELMTGELRDRKKAALPVMAALGGMIAPACIYLFMQYGKPGESGWGIPMATDIAFVVGFLVLLGPRVPYSLKILVLSLAIADDIGAVLVIAVFYSADISFVALGVAALGFGLTYFFNRIGVRPVPIYVVIGAGIWLAVLKSGVHPTVAGVLLGLLTPSSAWVGDRRLLEILGDSLHRLRHERDGEVEPHQRPMLAKLQAAAREAVSPLERLESILHPWVAFLIMPVFALANAGVVVELKAITHPVSLAVGAGLFLGKPLGIVLFSWLAVKTGLASLPSGVNWKVMIGAGFLAGIGFTMSLFIAGLALDPELLDAGKIGTLTGSVICSIVGCTLLVVFLPSKAKRGAENSES